jgi:tetratricopeptide (TPR) repeat protein
MLALQAEGICMTEQQTEDHIAEWQRIVQEGNDAYARRRYTEAELAFIAALRIAEKAGSSEELTKLSVEEQVAAKTRLAKSLNNMAALYHTQGKYNMAEDLYKRCLELKKETHGDEHLEVAISLHNLAVLHSAKRRFADAEPLYKTALELKERLLGVDHPELVTLLTNYALCLKRMDRAEEAKNMEARAEKLAPKKSDPLKIIAVQYSAE